MAARRKSTKSRSKARPARPKAANARAALVENVQQVWLAGMGAIARAQKEGPAAFQDAVADGLKLLNRSRAQTEKVIRDAFEAAQSTMQTRVEGVREQAGGKDDEKNARDIKEQFQIQAHGQRINSDADEGGGTQPNERTDKSG